MISFYDWESFNYVSGWQTFVIMTQNTQCKHNIAFRFTDTLLLCCVSVPPPGFGMPPAFHGPQFSPGMPNFLPQPFVTPLPNLPPRPVPPLFGEGPMPNMSVPPPPPPIGKVHIANYKGITFKSVR